ncbi:MAG: DUF2141 domain-containing protein [Bacteroidales bacterium]|nr:DUF2141 domain-containing protein [Bacteroidales bacterium]
MKKSLLLLLVLLFIKPLILFAQFSLTIELNNLRNNNGQILLQIYDENQNKVKGAYGSIINKKCVIIIENLKSGRYAFKYFHDENKNDKLDTNWIGIPNEGYGFSNNAKGTFGPPSFEKWIFQIKDNKKMICNPNY